MESKTNWLSQTSHEPLTIFLILVIIFCLYLILKPRWCCKCNTCKTYLDSTWRHEFLNLCDWYTHLLRKSPTHTIHIHALGNIVTANPENIEYMLKTRFDNYPKGKPFSVILGDLLGRGIFNVDGDLWRFQRKMASLELCRSSIKAYCFEVVNFEIENRLVPLLSSFIDRKSSVLDLQDVFRRFTFDSICKISFGLDPKCLELCLPISEFADSFDLASNLSAERAMTTVPLIWKLKRLFNIGSERRLKRAINMINVLANEVIRQRRKKDFSNDHDLLSKFMDSSVTDDDTLLRDIVISFVLAGRDTVASALTSLFWVLANHPLVSEAVRDEADRVIANQEVTSIGQLQKLHYLQAVIYEGMRLYPPVQFDSKFCLDDDILPDGTFVKSGTRVTYHTYAMGRMKEYWGTDCLEFKPERWLKDGVFSQENPFKYPVFHAGVRVCLGKEMAMLELKCVILCLLRRFDIQLSSPTHMPQFSPGLTATFSGGLPVLVRERMP